MEKMEVDEAKQGEYLSEVTLTEDGGVVKKVISAGTGPKPAKNNEVFVHYTGFLEDGSVFDTSIGKDEGFKFIIGAGHVIDGWEIGIMDMQVGEKADLCIKPEYGYGEIGSLPKIPSNANLRFTVELLNTRERRPAKWMMNDEERVKASMKLKEEGGQKFQAKEFAQAEGLYREAISHLDAIQNDNTDSRTLKKTILVNIAVCCNKSQSWVETVRACTQSLAIDNQNPKAFYHRSSANRKLKQYDDALADLKSAIKLSPKDKMLRKEFQTCKNEKKAYDKSQTKMFSNFFSQGVYNEKDPDITQYENELPEYNPSNPIVFLDIQIGDAEAKRVVFELFNEHTPRAAENFRCLCTGEKSTEEKNLHYKGNIFHRIISGFMAQGGDITKQNGTGGESIYGDKFNDEKFWYPHTHGGLLSMANSGPNTNGSQFFITFKKTSWLDGKHTVFGRVIQGFEHVKEIEKIETGENDYPLTKVFIKDCGQLNDELQISELELERYSNPESQESPETKK
ncbi:unnamed protein product [Moneuplotes crassus]|uniref:peptidylprolyl isomerase n=2 Tax=Euplotes crassus TaxID=5936 RepID=A0AAD1XDK9_EUPCR|nr:unnamed protein product [Moneuplotes crassus]